MTKIMARILSKHAASSRQARLQIIHSASARGFDEGQAGWRGARAPTPAATPGWISFGAWGNSLRGCSGRLFGATTGRISVALRELPSCERGRAYERTEYPK